MCTRTPNTFAGPVACSRAGNAIVMVLGVLTIVAGAILVSTNGMIASSREATQSSESLKAVAAVEAVLARHERSIIDLADNATLADFGVDDNANQANKNYGVDYIGDCAVRWKIEPCRTNDAGGIKYMINPPPTGAVDNPLGLRQPNDIISLFRISAEAQTAPDVNCTPTAIAQGARFVVVLEEPLFRYVIFYAQDGAKGDLEFTHDPQVVIRGNVHSNGAIYIGASTLVNDWAGAVGASQSTKIGPDADGNPVKVTGVNGIFCLSKPLMFGALNGYPMAGFAPSGWSVSSAYGGTTPVTDATEIINPRQVKDAAGFHTNKAIVSSRVRQINGIDILSGISLGNDARDDERADDKKWNPTSLAIWQRKVRSKETGGRRIPLSLGANVDASSRPFEPQPLTRNSTAPDVPENYAPGMSTPTGTLEVPGYYLAQALGGTAVGMNRKTDGTGWTITTGAGAAGNVGLVIRERPIPDTSIWPGSDSQASVPMAPKNPNFMPYAYGKHWYPTPQPFFPLWVSENLGTTDPRDWEPRAPPFGQNGQDGWREGINTEPNMSKESYLGGGRLQVTAACRPGPINEDIWFGDGGSPDPVKRYKERFGDTQEFFRENWRFINLRRPTPGTATLVPGVTASLFVENQARLNIPSRTRHMFQGVPTHTATLGSINIASGAMASAMGITSAMAPAMGIPDVTDVDNYQLRFEAYVYPQYSEEYTFVPRVDDGVRVWLDGELVVNSWTYQAGDRINPDANRNFLKTVRLQKHRPYHLVVDMWEDDNPDLITLKWKSASQALLPIPTGTGTASSRVGLFTIPANQKDFAKNTFRSATIRLDRADLSASGLPANLKAGLMIRDGSAGLSGIQSGRDSYVMVGFNPTRGIFTQRRLEPSGTTRMELGVWYVGEGAKFQRTSPPGPEQTVPTGGLLHLKKPFSIRQNIGNGDEDYVVTRVAKVQPTYTRTATTTETYASHWDSDTWALARQGSFSMDGRVVTVTYGFQPGYQTSTKARTWYKQARDRYDETQTFTLSSGSADFDVTGGHRYLLFWNHPTETSTWPPDIWCNTTGANWFSRTFPRVLNWATTYSPVDTSASITYQSHYVYSEDNPDADLSEVVTRMNDIGFPNPVPASPAWVSHAPITMPPGPLTAPAFPDPVPTPAPPYWNEFGTSPITFARVKAEESVDLSYNSYVSSSGTWFGPTPASPSTPAVPRQHAWQPDWTLSGWFPPLTRSFPPDKYTGGLPGPAIGDTATTFLPTLLNTRWSDDQPTPLLTLAAAPELFLRIERDMTFPLRTVLIFKYYMGPLTNPADSDFQTVIDSFGANVIADITHWVNADPSADPTIQIGPCLQSGDKLVAVTTRFSNMEIKMDEAAPLDVIDFNDWDIGVAGLNTMSAYLASQYQVFWGTNEITQDFFSFNQNNPSRRLASEDVWVNPREFWSQSRRWEDGSEKDLLQPGFNAYSENNTVNRQWWARSTFLTLNLREIQNYITTTDLNQAMNHLPFAAVPVNRPAPGIPLSPLSGRFNGLIYAARTNRYPWNPNTASTNNPFSCNTSDPSSALPNGSANTGWAVNLSATSMGHSSMLHNGTIHKLQPYAIGNPASNALDLGAPANNADGIITKAPPFKPQHFHHSVRLINGSDINWGAVAGGRFGLGKTMIVTPNQLFVEGDFNTVERSQELRDGTFASRATPVALAADQITLLSNAFSRNLPKYKVFQAYSSPAASTLNLPLMLLGPNDSNFVGNASTTSYNAALITNNQPTTRLRVKEGQGAPFIDTLMFIEKWGSGVTMNYKGSLVVIDSKRYTDAFLLDSFRTNGRGPMGVMGWNASTTYSGTGTAEWTGTVPPVYAAPDRNMVFNTDLLTEEGTPPFTPIGVSSNGLGGWVRVIK